MPSVSEEIIIRSIQKNATSEELAILNKWLKEEKENVIFYYQLEDIWNSRKCLSKDIIDKGWQLLGEEIKLRSKRVHPFIIPVKNLKSRWVHYVAAVLVGVLISSVVWMNLTNIPKESQQNMFIQNVIYNKTGVQSIILPDRSKVWINEESRIIYPETFTGETRLVKLEGKAYFEISENAEKPFIVQIGNLEIEVTGTEFFVESVLEEESTITLISGAVSLNYNNKYGKKTLTSLVPGEQARINHFKGKVEIENIDIDYFIAWKDGTYRFTNEPLEKIVSLLGKHFNVDIYITTSLRNKRFTGRVVPGENIDDVLNSIAKSYPIKFQITKERVHIIEK